MSLTRLVDATLENIGHFPDAKWEASEVKELLQDVAEYIPSEEQIARAIDPSAWQLKEDPRYAHLPPEAGQSVVRKSLEQARAVVALFHGGESNEHNRA